MGLPLQDADHGLGLQAAPQPQYYEVLGLGGGRASGFIGPDTPRLQGEVHFLLQGVCVWR